MKKKVVLSLVGLVCFGFLFAYNLTSSNDGLKAENIEALASGSQKYYNENNTDGCDTNGGSGCSDGGTVTPKKDELQRSR